MKRTGARAGFTIIELLVVITITVMLLGLIIGPVVQTFGLTRQAQAMVQAQDTARSTLSMISRDLSQAMFVYDNSNSAMNFPCIQPDGVTPVVLSAQYGKVDMILPKLTMHCNNPDHHDGSRDYERGDEAWPRCPVCGSDEVEARPRQPLTPDAKIVRYFIGLVDNDPASISDAAPNPGYRDWPETGSPLNGFILYRAEVNPYDDSEDPMSGHNLFRYGADGNPILDDPNFFYDTDIAPNGEPYWKNWKSTAKPVGLQTETDLVILRLNNEETAIVSLTPSVRFQLSQVTNDTFEPSHIADESAESPISIPSVFKATYGGWGTSTGPFNTDIYSVTVFRPGGAAGDAWFRTRWDWNGATSSYHLVIYKYTGGGSNAIFDCTAYEKSGVFPASAPDIAFLVDPNRGEVRFDFPDSDVINGNHIVDMNKQVRDTWGEPTSAPRRTYRLTKFRSINANDLFQPRIVPGSEVVVGPDMSPDKVVMVPDGHGSYVVQTLNPNPVRYERVPFNLGDPGRNQYKIDYGMEDLAGQAVGRMIFSPAYDEPIPEVMPDGSPAQFVIRYKFQCNRDQDVLQGNYATKSLMQVTVGIRFYDRQSGKLYPLELSDKIKVRNLMR